MIAILCPTRGRPEQFHRMVESVKKTANIDNVLIFSASNGDDNYVKTQYPLDMPTAYMWNDLAIKAMAENPNIKLFMLGADDMIFSTPGWDVALMEHYNGLENKIHVYHLQDSRDKNGVPHPIVSREWINALGYFVPPIFLHWRIDTWTKEIAVSNNCFTHMRDYMLLHDKASDRGEADMTFIHIRSMGWRERDAYVAQSCSHYLEYEKKRLTEHIDA